MSYTIFNPPEHLSKLVRYYWFLDYQAETDQDILKIFADPYPRIIFQHNNGNSCIKKAEGVLSNSFLAGITTVPYECTIGSCEVTGVSLYPHAMKILFGTDAHELRDDLVELLNFAPGKLTERILESNNKSQRIEILNEFLTIELNRRELAVDPLIYGALEWMEVPENTCRIDYYYRYFKMSERHLERQFRNFIGVSPKKLLRIKRFEKSMLMLASPEIPFTEIAYHLNFSDQSHFIKDFNDLSGLTPGLFRKQKIITSESNSIVTT
ncbi:hypothetical protein DHW03_15175 [Pedobacter yonginense]|uniref:HTH araC/xylS-type domain-containing protein n=1 Tax=Pedobacter yonginense TaxID=651869 RepID=A0A317ELH1_9SPHI|nr:helix-turn-helix domain-containing protein [Pedobacter yonginense]PWS26136.1 hypothetical protein DHW03_15175 [Pedobacter yonginense]